MKVLDRCLIIVFNLCLLLVAVWVSAVPIAKNSSYYHLQFKVNNIYGYVDNEGNEVSNPIKYLGGSYQYAKYTNKQLDTIIDHIIDFLFNDKEDFALELENVYVSNSRNGEYHLEEKVDVFGEVAIKHMHDVKQLFIIYQIISVIAFVLMLGIGAYLLLRIGQVRKILFEYTMLFYGLFISICSIFVMVNFALAIIEYQESSSQSVMNFFSTFEYVLWQNIHWLFFPFQPDKVEGSFFNDTLTSVLTTDLFITAVIIVLVVIALLQILWLSFTVVMKLFGGRIAYKIKEYKYKNSISIEPTNSSSNS